MSTLNRTTPFMAVALLVSMGLACHKPEAAPAPQPEKAKMDTTAQDQAKAKDEALKRTEADEKRKAEEAAEAAEAARKAAAAKDAEYHKAAEAALKDVHFDFDKSEIKETEKVVLVAIADFMKAYPQASLMIEGNCDERGTVEYNLALGDRRASAVQAYLVGLGVQAARLNTTSYGKEKPLCTESTEFCWTRNRRAHFSLK
jgi:peptidoglycan-associated lipoprotein